MDRDRRMCVVRGKGYLSDWDQGWSKEITLAQIKLEPEK